MKSFRRATSIIFCTEHWKSLCVIIPAIFRTSHYMHLSHPKHFSIPSHTTVLESVIQLEHFLLLACVVYLCGINDSGQLWCWGRFAAWVAWIAGFGGVGCWAGLVDGDSESRSHSTGLIPPFYAFFGLI